MNVWISQKFFVGFGVCIGVLDQDIGMICDFQCLFGVLFYYQDWQISVCYFDDVVEQFVYYDWVYICGWFVEYQNFGLGYQGVVNGYLLMLII